MTYPVDDYGPIRRPYPVKVLPPEIRINDYDTDKAIDIGQSIGYVLASLTVFGVLSTILATKMDLMDDLVHWALVLLFSFIIVACCSAVLVQAGKR